MNSVQEISQSFNPPNFDLIPINRAQAVFKIEEIPEIKVANIIRRLNTSKAKDNFGLDTNFLKEHKDSLICLITHIINKTNTALYLLVKWA